MSSLERATVPLCAVLVLALALAGCRVEAYQSPLQPTVPIVGSGLLCIGPGGVDTYVLDVFALAADGVERPVNATLCSLCATGDPRVSCEHLMRVCRCSAPRDDSASIEEALSGIRFDGLPGDRTLCARMVLLSRGTPGGPSEGPAVDCPTSAACPRDADLSGASLCALTDAFALGPSETPIAFEEFACGGLLDPSLPDAGVSCPELMRLCEERGLRAACQSYQRQCVPDAGATLSRPLTLAACAAF